MSDIISKYNNVVEKINKINDNVTLVAVSKYKPIEDILKLYEMGHRDFGESRVQEFINKYESLPKDINWHFIGHLQTNKVKYVIGKVNLIHSVDSKKLVDEINKYSAKKNLITNILIQINLSNDINKYGISREESFELVNYASKLNNIKIMGFMLIPRYDMSNDELKALFNDFVSLSLDITVKNNDNIYMKYLSFGMSDDYELAILNGSNMVRVGSKIFGAREYNY